MHGWISTRNRRNWSFRQKQVHFTLYNQYLGNVVAQLIAFNLEKRKSTIKLEVVLVLQELRFSNGKSWQDQVGEDH